MKIYGDTKSGNCLKVKWVCDHLALPYTWIAIDILKQILESDRWIGETEKFLGLFPAHA